MAEALDTGLLPRRGVPVILQAEVSECGLACVAMVLGAYGRDVPLSTLRKEHPVSHHGMSVFELQQVCSAQGLQMTAYEAEPQELEPLRLPAIAYWDRNHYVVITRLRVGRDVIVHDPGVGQLSYSWKEFCEHYSGIVAEAVPAPNFKKESVAGQVSAWSVLRLAGTYKALLFKLLLLSLFLEIAVLVSPLFLQTVVDQVLPVRDERLLFTLAFGFVCVTLVKVTARISRDWMGMALSGFLNASFKSSVFSHMLNLPLSWFDKRGLGLITTRFVSVSQIRDILSEGLVTMLIDALLAVLMLVVMLLYSPVLALVTLVVSLLTLLATLIVQGAYTRANTELIQASAKEQNSLIEIVTGIAAVKFFGREAQQQRVYEAAMMRTENRNLDALRLKTLHGATTFTVQSLEEIVVISLAAYMALNNELTVGAMFGFYAYKQIFSTKMSAVADALMQLRLLRLHAETVGDILASDREPPPKGPLQVSAKPTLSLRELTYRYPGSETHTLLGFSLEVGRGEIVGVTGPSGAGKSTLLKLLTGALQPDSGQILVDGVDITRMPPKDYRTALSVVLQDDSIFTGTVMENITMFEPVPDSKRAAEAAKAAALHDDILDMPMQYQTHIFAGSPALSGGQRQRLLLARAFYKNAPVLVLDEATSHLDVVREKQVVQAIRERAMTTLMVAHRKETLDGCDRVVRLEKLHADARDEDAEG